MPNAARYGVSSKSSGVCASAKAADRLAPPAAFPASLVDESPAITKETALSETWPLRARAVSLTRWKRAAHDAASAQTEPGEDCGKSVRHSSQFIASKQGACAACKSSMDTK